MWWGRVVVYVVGRVVVYVVGRGGYHAHNPNPGHLKSTDQLTAGKTSMAFWP